MRFPHRALVLAALILGAPAAALVPSGAQPTLTSGPHGAWHIETATTYTAGSRIAMALDAQDRPHVMYPDWENTLQYRTRTTLGWSAPQLVHENAIYPSLAFAPDGTLHATYYSLWPDDPAEQTALVHAWLENGTWHREVIDAQDAAGAGSRLVIDSAGRLHVAYGYTGPPLWDTHVRYAFNDGSGWSIETIEEADSSRFGIGLALDSQSRPHAAYCRFVDGNCEAIYATRQNDGSWKKETADPHGGSHIQLALDSTDRPHLAYEDRDPNDRKLHETLAHATRNQTGDWTITTVDADSPTARFLSLALDAHDRPHISYWQVFNRANTNDPLRSHIKYATLNPLGEWSTEFINPLGWSFSSELRISSTGHPKVAYVYIGDQTPETPFVPTRRHSEVHYAEPVRGMIADALLRLTP